MSQENLDAYMEAAGAINARHISDDAAERLLAPAPPHLRTGKPLYRAVS
jgi:hypothetical protein